MKIKRRCSLLRWNNEEKAKKNSLFLLPSSRCPSTSATTSPVVLSLSHPHNRHRHFGGFWASGADTTSRRLKTMLILCILDSLETWSGYIKFRHQGIFSFFCPQLQRLKERESRTKRISEGKKRQKKKEEKNLYVSFNPRRHSYVKI